jgi:hypothetical protein
MVFIPFPPGEVAPDPPVLGASGIEINRTLTSWFISQDPVDVVLTPRVTGRTASGATATTDGPPRPAQRVTFVYGGNTGAGRAGIVEAGDGRDRMFSYVMVMEWDAEIEIADHFTDQEGQHWEVEEILPLNGYEIKATMRSYGRSPQYG